MDLVRIPRSKVRFDLLIRRSAGFPTARHAKPARRTAKGARRPGLLGLLLRTYARLNCGGAHDTRRFLILGPSPLQPWLAEIPRGLLLTTAATTATATGFITARHQ